MTGSRVEFAEILRRERDQCLLTLAATHAVVERRATRWRSRSANETELTWRERDFIAEHEGEALAIESALHELSAAPFEQ